MSYVARDEKELAEAIKKNEDEIEIEGDLKEMVIKIKAKGTVTWAVCIGAIAIIVTGILMSSKDSDADAIFALTGTTIAGILGISTIVSCVGMAVEGGGVSVLNELREYTIEQRDDRTFLVK